MDEKIIIAILSSSVISTILNFVFNYINKRNEDKSMVAKALMCLLGYEVKTECRRLIKAKEVDLVDYEQLQELNTLYHQMGGNGYVKNLMDKVGKLEVKQND